MAVKVGATLVLEKSFAFPQVILEPHRRGEGHRLAARADHGGAPPADAGSASRARFPHLRYITNTAAALPPAHIARLQELFPAAKLFSMYGLTECKRCTYLPPAELDRRPGSVGIAIPGTEAYVVDEDGRARRAGRRRRAGHPRRARDAGLLGEPGGHRPRRSGPGRSPGRRCSTPATSSAPTRRASSTSSAARTTSSRPAARRSARRKSRTSSTRSPGVREAAVIGVPDPILGMADQGGDRARARGRRSARRTSSATAPGTSRTSWCRSSSNSATALPKTETGKISRRLVEAESCEAARMTPRRRLQPPRRNFCRRRRCAIDAEPPRSRASPRACATQVLRKLRRRGAVRRPLRRHRFERDGGACRAGARAASGCSALLMPERDSDPESLRLGRAGRRLARHRAASSRTSRRCSRRPAATGAATTSSASSFRNSATGWGCKVVIANALAGDGYNITYLVVQSPAGETPQAPHAARRLSRHRRRDQHEAAHAQADRILSTPTG